MTKAGEFAGAGDGDFNRPSAGVTENSDSLSAPETEGLVADPGATEVRILEVSRAPEQIGSSAIASTKRAGLRVRTGHIALVYPEPIPDGHGGYTLSAATPNFRSGQASVSGSYGRSPFSQPSIL